ncbi:hypothetical protein NL676_016808 [Syzygium grande]|nr:hypothetical protein NL676_016808 [Syzygium grande]
MELVSGDLREWRKEEDGGRGRSSVARQSESGLPRFQHGVAKRADATQNHRARRWRRRGTNCAAKPDVFRVAWIELNGRPDLGPEWLDVRSGWSSASKNSPENSMLWRDSCELAIEDHALRGPRGRACEHEARTAKEWGGLGKGAV